MRILTLIAGREALPDVCRLQGEIRSFNAEIDFRLRFLHIEIDQVFLVAPELGAELAREVERADVRKLEAAGPLEAAARLALLLGSERPDLFVITGQGELREPGGAAAAACGTKLAFYGAGRGDVAGGRDLGEDPRAAVELLTGVAREID